MNDDEDFEGEGWDDLLRRIGENDPSTTSFDFNEIKAIDIDCPRNMTDEDWEELGRDISNNTYLEILALCYETLNDRKLSCLFRGLTESCSIKELGFYENGFSVAAVRSMVPFLQRANNLTCLDLDNNNIQSEGFNLLLRALSDSPIERLDCDGCDIKSIEIDSEHIPKHLRTLSLRGNSINADGCRELAKLLQGGDAKLGVLSLQENNEIDDDGVEILVNALQRNTSLTRLNLEGNNKISKRGQLMLLKLVGDVSSIEATLQCNHTLSNITFETSASDEDARIISEAISMVLENTYYVIRNRRARAKVIWTQLHSATRAMLAELQGVNHSVYSEINPLHLPEVLALVGHRHGHGQGEFYVALKSSIAGVISIVNEKECLKQENSYYRAKIAEYRAKVEANEAKIAAIEASEAPVVDIKSEPRCNKRRRK